MKTKPQSNQSFVICGPSGSGKSTLLRRLLSEHKDKFTFTVSHTTRKPRKGELNGREYHFVGLSDMLEMIERNDFIEHTQFSGNYYGTSRRAVVDASKESRDLIIEVDVEGVKALQSIKELKPIFIFIKPPSKQLLLERLASRGTETLETLARRLARADKELELVENGFMNFDLVLVNDDLDETYNTLKKFLSLS